MPLVPRAPTSMAVDPSCMHLIAAFDDGSVDVWPLPGLHRGVEGGSIQTCRERLWTSMEHDGAITGARVWTNYEEPFLYQVGGLAAAASGGASMALSSSSSSGGGGGQPTGAMAVGTGGFTADILKKLAAASTLATSSEDRSVILWLFAPAMSNAGAGAGNAGPGVSRFLQPTPARRFHFSSVPSRALCFHSSATDYRRLSLLTMTNSMLQELAEAPWQVSVIVDGRAITAVKAAKHLLLRASMPPSRVKAATTLARMKMELLLRDDASVSSEGSSVVGGGGGGGGGGGPGSVELHGAGAQLSFIPVVSPVVSASHASEVMARRAHNFSEGSLTLLDAWAAPRVKDHGRAGVLGGGKPFVSEKWMSIGNSGTSQRPRSPGQPDVIMVRVRDHTTLLDVAAADAGGGPASLRVQKKAQADATMAASEHPPLVDRRAHVILDGLRLRVPSPVAGFGDASLGLTHALNVDYSSLEYGGFPSSSETHRYSGAPGQGPAAFMPEHSSSISIPTGRAGPPSPSSPSAMYRPDEHEGSEEGSLATAMTTHTALSPHAKGRPAGAGVTAEPSIDLSVGSPQHEAGPPAAVIRPLPKKTGVRISAPPGGADRPSQPHDIAAHSAAAAAAYELPVGDAFDPYRGATVLRPGSSPTAPLSRERVRGKFAVGRGPALEGAAAAGGGGGSSHTVMNNASIGFDQVIWTSCNTLLL